MYMFDVDMLCVWAALVCRPCVATEVGSVVRLRLREAEGRLSSLIGRQTLSYEKERDVTGGSCPLVGVDGVVDAVYIG
jgi:hypothetical protein